MQEGGGREVPSTPSRPIRLHPFLSRSKPFTSPQTASEECRGGGGREVPSPPSRPIRLHPFLSPSQPFTSPQTASAKALDKTVFDFNNTCSL